MAKLPLIEQQTSVGQVRASGQDFGAGVGQAVAQAGNALQDIGVAMKRREDVIERVNLMNDFDRWAQESLTALNDSEDIARAETVAKYEQGLRQKADEIIRTHRGTGASRAELEAQVRNQVGQYAKSAIGAQVKAQQQKIGSMIEQKSNELAISAAFAPDQMNNVFAQLDNDISQFEGAMSPALMAQYKEAGRSKIATGAIAQVLQRGDWQSAEKMLKDPEVGKYLDPNTARKFTIDVAVDKGKAAAVEKEKQERVSRFTLALGRDLTASERMKVEMMPPKKDMTPVDEIAMYEIVTGQKADRSVVDRILGMEGNQKSNRLQYIATEAPRYQSGQMSPAESLQYVMTVAQEFPNQVRENSRGGIEIIPSPTMPPELQRVFGQSRPQIMGTMPGVGSAGGVPFSVQPPVATDGSSIAPGSVVQFSDASGRVIGQGRTDAQGFTTIRDQNPPGRPAEQRSLFQRMKTAVGIGPAAQSFVGGLPVVGEPFRSSFPETAQITQDRRYLNNATNDLVTALQNNPKYPEGEREAIRAEVGNLAATFTNPSAAMDAAYAVDLSLEQRLAKAEKVINDPSNPEDLRMEAKAVYNAVKQFRENVLNVPRPKNNAELREMINTDRIVVGEDFFTPEGQRKTLTKEGVDMLFRAK